MDVQFLAHSGFFVELEQVCLLFDWWKGALPPLPDKPLLVFVSHHHPDHFDPRIFTLDQPGRTVRFLLGKDIRFAPCNCRRWQLRPETAEKCLHLGGFRKERPLPGVLVETLPSTDTGVAFLVQTEGKTIFHAGDLNWWYWSGEHADRNRAMEQNFRQYMEPLRGRVIDLAMMPLDPRQEEGNWRGLSYLLQLAQVERVIPMHQWGDYSATGAFCSRFPQWQDKILPIVLEGQQFHL